MPGLGLGALARFVDMLAAPVWAARSADRIASCAAPAPNPAAQRSPGNAGTAQLRDATGHRLPR